MNQHCRTCTCQAAEVPEGQQVLPMMPTQADAQAYLRKQTCIDCGASCWPHPYPHAARYEGMPKTRRARGGRATRESQGRI